MQGEPDTMKLAYTLLAAVSLFLVAFVTTTGGLALRCGEATAGDAG
jgi:hypothetical protein